MAEKNAIGLVEILMPEFLEKNGWNIHPDYLPEKFYIKNRYPVALKMNEGENYFEVFEIKGTIIGREVLSVILSNRDYDKFIIPILGQFG